jgi:hypothetical protein
MRRAWMITVSAILLLCPAWAQQRRAAAGYGVIPQGTQLSVRMIDGLSSATAKADDTFHATLEQAVVVNGRTEYPKGADVTGTVARVHSSGRLSDPGELDLTITSIAGYPVSVVPLRIKGGSHAKSNATKIGGGAAAGAIIGAIAGGGKGAAIGAGVGAAAGTGVAAATGKKEAVIESEAVLTWVTAAPAAHGWPTAAQKRDSSARGYTGEGTSSYDGPRRSVAPVFSESDRQSIRRCMVDNRAGLPPGLAKRDRLPPGLERQLRVNGTLPPGLQKRVQPLPGVCSAGLPRLPVDWVRVILGGRVLLLDRAQRIADMFTLEGDE